MQVYMVSGGNYWKPGLEIAYTGTSETLEKDGGSAWQVVASLPSARRGLRGLGLDNGRFIVTGQSSTTCITKQSILRVSGTAHIEPIHTYYR